MECGNELRPAVVVHPPTQPRNWCVGFQERSRRECAERDDDLRFDRVDLTEQERLAFLDFVGFRVAVLGWTALDDVCDVDIFALEPDGLDNLRQLLSGPADKRDALNIFITPRRLSDEHQVGMRIPDTEHDLLASEGAQLA